MPEWREGLPPIIRDRLAKIVEVTPSYAFSPYLKLC